MSKKKSNFYNYTEEICKTFQYLRRFSRHRYSPRGQNFVGFCNFIISVGIDLSKQTSESRVKSTDLKIQSLYVLTLSFSALIMHDMHYCWRIVKEFHEKSAKKYRIFEMSLKISDSIGRFQTFLVMLLRFCVENGQNPPDSTRFTYFWPQECCLRLGTAGISKFLTSVR